MSRGRVFSALLASVMLVAGLVLFGLPGRAYLSQQRTLTAAEVRLRVLSAENAKLDQRRQQLQTDAEIERLARQQYGLVKPGEEAYAILPPKPAPAATSAAAPPPAKKKTSRAPWWQVWR
jgi:cell division protein FtsB